MSYAPKLAAALSGATIRQLAYWRKPGPDGLAVLAPEYSATRPIDYSFRDVIALRTCVRLRREASLQKIRRAVDTLRVDLGLRDQVAAEDIGEFFPQVSPEAARDAYDFASYVDSYVQSPERAA